MGTIQKAQPVKLIAGFIFKDQDALSGSLFLLNKAFGKTDYESPPLAFTHTSYYSEEFGDGLRKKFISFKKLVSPERLCRIKIFTNKIEKKFSLGANRLINIDPGYLDMAKLVLASTKNYNHRIYLDKGIFAEITLTYKNKSFIPWQWTYPDYSSPDYISVFNRIRDI
ncbi:MAG: DUF4416 family protein, partial [Candidatus Omnitrophica bacterium]|nr:DUF4416 family protein [Candidatus Omnitrophota bacterium]